MARGYMSVGNVRVRLTNGSKGKLAMDYNEMTEEYLAYIDGEISEEEYIVRRAKRRQEEEQVERRASRRYCAYLGIYIYPSDQPAGRRWG